MIDTIKIYTMISKDIYYTIKENSIVFLNINIPDNNQFNDISSLVKIN